MLTLHELDFRNRPEVDLFVGSLSSVHLRSMTIYPQFLAALTETYNTEGYYFYCADRDTLSGIASVYEGMNLFSSRSLSSVPGGFWAAGEESEVLLLNALYETAARRNLKALELKDLHAPLSTLSARNDVFRAIRRLNPGKDDLMSAYSKNIRRDIRNAAKYGLRMEESSDIEPFYAVWAHHMRDLGTPPLSLDYFKHLRNAFGDESKIFLVTMSNEIIGGAFVLHNRTYATDLYLSSLRSHFKYLPNVFLYHEMMSWAARSGIEFFDLGRSQPSGTNEYFKLRFGAELLPLYSYPGSEGEPPGWMRLFQGIWKRVPVSISNRLGHSIRRYRPFA